MKHLHPLRWLALALLAACSKRPATPPQQAMPVEIATVPAKATPDAAGAPAVAPSTSPIRRGQFLADGTLVIDHGDQLVLLGGDGVVRARIPYEKPRYGEAWVVSRTASTPEIALYRREGGKHIIRFFDPAGHPTASIAVDDEEAKTPAIVQASARRVLFRANRNVRVVDRANGKTIATVKDAPSMIDDDATRGVSDMGAGQLEVIELDGSGIKKPYFYAADFIDSDGWQGADGLSFAPDGRMLAIQEPKGVSILELPSGRRTALKGTRLFASTAVSVGGESTARVSTWSVPNKIALTEGATLLLVDRGDLKKTERFSPKKPCEGISDCQEKLLQWNDVQWTKSGPVVLMTSWPVFLSWTPGEPVRSFDSGDREAFFGRLSPDGRHVLHEGRGTVRVYRVAAGAREPWTTVLEHKADEIRAAISRDGTRVATWDPGGYRLFEIESGRKIVSVE